MATVRRELSPEEALFLAASFPQYIKINGTSMPVSGLAYDATAATSEAAHWQFVMLNYGSGNITATIYWYADTASTGAVMWECNLRAVTANADTQDVETDAYATATSATDTHLGTVGQRLHTQDVVISNLDSVANLDFCTLRVARVSANAADTMAGDAVITAVVLSYSDV